MLRANKPVVSFVCQKCCQPLKLDPTIAALNEKQIQEMKHPVSRSNSEVDSPCCPQNLQILIPEENYYEAKDETAEIRTVPMGRRLENSSDACNDFTILCLPDVQTEETLSIKMMIISQLFDVMSGHSDVDHPLCEECTDTLLDQLDQQLKETENEYQLYNKLLEKLNSSNDTTKVRRLDDELRELTIQEANLESQLCEIEKQHKLVQEDIIKEKKLNKKLEEESERYYKEYYEYKRQLNEYEDAQKSVKQQVKYADKQMDKLKKTNVFNITFHIWYWGHFGTINGFRIGRLPGVPVEWNEINAGWGLAALLLHSLANKIGLVFKRYKIVPYGNRSYMESLTDKSKEYPLYGSGGFKFFWDTKFDDGMVAYLDCLQQFKEELEKRSPTCRMPYKMENGRIEDSNTGIAYPIKVLLNSEEQWTKALKLMLTNLKWGLVCVTADGCQTSNEMDYPQSPGKPQKSKVSPGIKSDYGNKNTPKAPSQNKS